MSNNDTIDPTFNPQGIATQPMAAKGKWLENIATGELIPYSPDFAQHGHSVRPYNGPYVDVAEPVAGNDGTLGAAPIQQPSKAEIRAMENERRKQEAAAAQAAQPQAPVTPAPVEPVTAPVAAPVVTPAPVVPAKRQTAAQKAAAASAAAAAQAAASSATQAAATPVGAVPPPPPPPPSLADAVGEILGE